MISETELRKLGINACKKCFQIPHVIIRKEKSETDSSLHTRIAIFCANDKCETWPVYNEIGEVPLLTVERWNKYNRKNNEPH